jgi:hypothetical protein
MSGRILWVLAALALGFAVLVGLLWRAEAPRATAAAPAERSRSAASRAEPGFPRAAARDERDEGAPRVLDEAYVELLPSVRRPASGAARPAPVNVQGLVLHGRVRAPVEDLASVELELVRVSSRPGEPLRMRCAPDGGYRFEATALLPALSQPPETLSFELRATHSECLPSRVPFEVRHAPLQERGGGARAFAWRDGTTVCELDVALEPASRVRGHLAGVADPRRFAIAAVLLRDGRPTPPWLADTRPDAQGDFEFLLPRAADCALVAAGDGFRPLLVDVDLARPQAREVTITPGRGARLEGSVRLAAQVPREEFQLELLWPSDPQAPRPERWRRLAPDQEELCWIDGAFEWRRHHARTTFGGRFAFDGLASREYELRALGVGVPGVELRAWSVARLRAPAYGLVLGPVLSSVDFDLGPVVESPPRFVLVDEHSTHTLQLGPFATDARGFAQVHLPPGRGYRVLVEDQAVGRVDTPAAGEFALFALAR